MIVLSRTGPIVIALFLCFLSPAAALAGAQHPTPPLDFEINQGQSDPRVQFLSRGSGYTLLLTVNGAVMRLSPHHVSAGHARSLRAAAVTMTWLGAALQPAIEGLDPLEARSHYFIGNDPARWRTNVVHYARVRYRSLYPGVDLVYYSNASRGYGDANGDQQRIEYDLLVAPGADPGVIRLEIDGVDSAAIDQRGDLLLTTEGGVITQHRPVIYQEIDGVRRPVAGSYVVQSFRQGRHEIGFQVASYDASRPLVIDPVLALSTYWGGSMDDQATAVGVNINTGDIYLAGYTDSVNDFPTVNPTTGAFNDMATTYAFLTRLNAKGTAVVYSTFIGGSETNAASITQALGLDVDGGGSAYVTGWTDAEDFPVTAGVVQATHGGASDAFVVKVNPSGNALVYATYLGGTGSDQGNGIKVSGAAASVVGTTESDDFPTQVPWQSIYGGGASDLFVAKLNDAGTALVFSTYFGGAGTEEGLALAVGIDGGAILTGLTNSDPFHIEPALTAFQPDYGGGATDAFVARFSADGRTLIYSTYLGGDGDDIGRAVTTDVAGDAFVTGETASTTFPTTTDALQAGNQGGKDVFMTEVASLGTSLLYSTYLGGSQDDVGYGIALSPEDFIYLTGRTASSASFPQQNFLQTAYGGGTSDAFVTRLTPKGQLDYSTYWGGGGDDAGLAIVVDIGTAHIVGATTSGDLQTLNPIMLTSPLYDGSNNSGGSDAFLLSLEDDQASGCNIGPFGGPLHPSGRFDPGLPIMMGAAAVLWWVRRLRRVRR